MNKILFFQLPMLEFVSNIKRIFQIANKNIERRLESVDKQNNKHERKENTEKNNGSQYFVTTKRWENSN